MLALITVAINKHFGLADRVEGVKGIKLNRKKGIPNTPSFPPPMAILSHGLIILRYVIMHNEQNLVNKIAGLSGGKI
jgi:hypothetical protein